MERGWVQHALMVGGKVCLVGAAVVVAEQSHLFYQYPEIVRERQIIVRALYSYMAEHQLITEAQDIPEWNDAQDRTVGEVLDMLEQAAIWVKEKASAW